VRLKEVLDWIFKIFNMTTTARGGVIRVWLTYLTCSGHDVKGVKGGALLQRREENAYIYYSYSLHKDDDTVVDGRETRSALTSSGPYRPPPPRHNPHRR